MKDLLPVLETIAKMGKPLVIIAEDVDGEPWPPWWSTSSGAPSGSGREAPASATAARPCWKISPPHRRPADFRRHGLEAGKCHRERVGHGSESEPRPDNTTIIDGGGDRAAIEGRVKQIRVQVDETTSDYDREKLQERLAKLVGASRSSVSARPLKWK